MEASKGCARSGCIQRLMALQAGGCMAQLLLRLWRLAGGRGGRAPAPGTEAALAAGWCEGVIPCMQLGCS